MSLGLSEKSPATARPSVAETAARRWRLRLASFCLIALVIINVPLFLRMPLDTDVLLYDVCARSLLHGGVEYRDAFQHGMPGMTWVQALVRGAVGWRFESLRLIDLIIVGTIVYLLTLWLRRLHRSLLVRTWTAAALVAFYFSTSENNHCQRDIWMLLPALAAVFLRVRRLDDALSGRASPQRTLVSAAGEGLLWGLAFWIKPFVAIPALACWLITSVQTLRSTAQPGRTIGLDTLGVLAGGVAAGAAGVGWLVSEGAWASFREIMFGWNPQYYAFARAEGWSAERLDDVFGALAPWGLVHLVAVPLALLQLWRGLKLPAGEMPRRWVLYQAVFAGFYLAWLFQALVLQNLLQYIQVPPILLAVTVIAGSRWPQFDWLTDPVLRSVRLSRDDVQRVDLRRQHQAWGWAVAGFATLALVWHPMFRPERWLLWPRCLTENNASELRDELALNDQADWQDLDQVAKYLIEQGGAKDQRLTCYSFSTPGLYVMLDIQPATRFPFLDSFLKAFPQRRPEIYDALRASKQKFVVTDLRTLGFTRQRSLIAGVPHLPKLDTVLPPDVALEFPWSLPIVFRAGSYSVHAVSEPIAWPDREDAEVSRWRDAGAGRAPDKK